jgi:hypothetical protein
MFRLVSPPVANSTRLGERPTVGRLSGLSAREADRGERALWLSGDGHRAALFHLGALTRLNELGLLSGLARIGAASGGSIAAALLQTRLEWPLTGPCADWEERFARPLRELAAAGLEEGRSGQRRRPFPGRAGEAALEERYARELLAAAGAREQGRGPSFVFGASGLALSGIGAAGGRRLEWDLDAEAPGGYDRGLLAELLGGPRTAGRAVEEPAAAVLENHGYRLVDAAARAQRIGAAEGAAAPPALVPHPDWAEAERVRAALAEGAARPRLRRPHLLRRGEADERQAPPRAG